MMNAPVKVCSIKAVVRNSESLLQFDPIRKWMISRRLVLPALLGVCFSVEPGWVSARRTLRPA